MYSIVDTRHIMIHGDITEKPAVRAHVLVQALENNYYPPEPAHIEITDEIPAKHLVYWELGIKAVVPVNNMYKLFLLGDDHGERIIGNVLNNLHNRGLLSLVNPRSVDGSRDLTVANLRGFRNRITTDKGLAGDTNLFIYDRTEDPHAALLFATVIVNIGGSACIRVPNVHTTQLACAIYLFASYFTTHIHRANDGICYIVGVAKIKSLRAETMFTLAAATDSSLYTADYMRGDRFRAAIAAMTVTPDLPTVEEWKRTYKYNYVTAV